MAANMFGIFPEVKRGTKAEAKVEVRNHPRTVSFLPMMQDLAARHRSAVENFRQRRGLSIHGWCTRADVDESTLRKFLFGKPNATPPVPPGDTMGYLQLAKLAAAEEVTVAELMGEILPRDAAMGTVAIPWLSVQTGMTEQIKVGPDKSRAPFRMPRAAVDAYLLGEPQRGLFYEVTADTLAPEIRRGDLLCIDSMRIIPSRDPGYYCVWNGIAAQIAHLTPLPANRVRFVAEALTAAATDMAMGDLDGIIIGRAVWRCGGL